MDKNILDLKKIGLRIRMEREKLNLSREKFAEIVGLSSFYIGQIERGERKMSLDTLAKIAAALHLSVDYLLYGNNFADDKLTAQEGISVLEAMDNSYGSQPNEDLQELLYILIRCSNRELTLIKDLIKLILPYIEKK